MGRHISNHRKLNAIRKYHKIHNPNDPFIFSMNEAPRIRQMIGKALVSFFLWLKQRP